MLHCRASYAKAVVEGVNPNNARLIAAFASVAREHYVGQPPWSIVGGPGDAPTVTDDPRWLYQDVLVVLAPERGINNGQPSLHACCLNACAPAAGEWVIHIGAGTGYYTAILAQLVGATGHVIAYEIEADLAAQARSNLEALPNVRVVAASAAAGPLPAADVIYVNAGATHPPAAWLDALNRGGRLIFPLTPNEGYGCMLLVTRLGASKYAATVVSRVVFIACIGARDETASRALTEALRTQPLPSVRSLRRGTPPDHTAWCVGTGWWLSTAEPE